VLLVKLQGGLGNQMFQYAFGLSLSQKLNSRLYFDLCFYNETDNHLTKRSYGLNVFPATVKIADDKLRNRFLRPTFVRKIINKLGAGVSLIYRENTLKFNKQIFNIKTPVYLEGFWQSERYFDFNETLIRKCFTFNAPLNQESEKLTVQLAGQVNTVSVHVRRGDYVTSKTTNELHGVCSVNYYLKAITMVAQRIGSAHFYFFSDDIQWVSENLLPKIDNYTLVQHNTGDESWQDMALMSKCKHHIIANSSFSWWGAWLNPDKEKIVIAPKNWFSKKTSYFDDRDLVPWNWMRISNG
jgi:glycosyl transferase family 11